MLIAIDYGLTYNRDPELFDAFIRKAAERGHRVVCVTMRDQANHPVKIPCDVIYTDGAKKKAYMARLGHKVDIWVDDWPETIA